jgi:hypothetical protein
MWLVSGQGLVSGPGKNRNVLYAFNRFCSSATSSQPKYPLDRRVQVVHHFSGIWNSSLNSFLQCAHPRTRSA